MTRIVIGDRIVRESGSFIEVLTSVLDAPI